MVGMKVTVRRLVEVEVDVEVEVTDPHTCAVQLISARVAEGADVNLREVDIRPREGIYIVDRELYVAALGDRLVHFPRYKSSEPVCGAALEDDTLVEPSAYAFARYVPKKCEGCWAEMQRVMKADSAEAGA